MRETVLRFSPQSDRLPRLPGGVRPAGDAEAAPRAPVRGSGAGPKVEKAPAEQAPAETGGDDGETEIVAVAETDIDDDAVIDTEDDDGMIKDASDLGDDDIADVIDDDG